MEILQNVANVIILFSQLKDVRVKSLIIFATKKDLSHTHNALIFYNIKSCVKHVSLKVNRGK